MKSAYEDLLENNSDKSSSFIPFVVIILSNFHRNIDEFDTFKKSCTNYEKNVDIHIINPCANVEVVIGSLGKISNKIQKKLDFHLRS